MFTFFTKLPGHTSCIGTVCKNTMEVFVTDAHCCESCKIAAVSKKNALYPLNYLLSLCIRQVPWHREYPSAFIVFDLAHPSAKVEIMKAYCVWVRYNVWRMFYHIQSQYHELTITAGKHPIQNIALFTDLYSFSKLVL